MKWKAIIVFAVPDPDLEIRCVWGEGLQKTFFQPFGPHCGLKIRGACPLGPSPGSATVLYHLST